MANKALVAFVKTIIEIRRNSDLIAFERDPRMTSRFGVGYRLKIGYGLHVGWAIEGAIGSDFKIDASYLSPHVTLTQRIQVSVTGVTAWPVPSDADERSYTLPRSRASPCVARRKLQKFIKRRYYSPNPCTSCCL